MNKIDSFFFVQLIYSPGLEHCNATDEQINAALPHIPPAFHQILRGLAYIFKSIILHRIFLFP